jgi:hypothetical protein
MGKNDSTYRKGATYRFHFVGHDESATYLGKGRNGMHRFLLAGDQIWTGYTANVTDEG